MTFELSDAQLAFVRERHLATLTTSRADGTPHVVPVAFTWDEARGLARVTTRAGSVKAGHLRRGATPTLPTGSRVALCQVEGQRWITLEGVGTVSDDPADVVDAVAAYAQRYRVLTHDPQRVVVHVRVDRVLGSVR